VPILWQGEDKMRKRLDLTGQTIGRLVVVAFAGMVNRRSYWWCQCDCGEYLIERGATLNNSSKQSCGCLHRENNRTRAVKHGESHTKLHNIWSTLKDRVLNPRCKEYKWYGAKGITVESDWLEYIPFRDWALTNGYEEGLSIDRVDSSKGYSPTNCRWITVAENARRAATR